MIALASALAFIGATDVLCVTVPATLRKIIGAVVGAGLLVVAAISSPWWATTGAILACALWLATYRGSRPVLFMLGTAGVLIGLAAPTILALLPSWSARTEPLSAGWQLYEWILVLVAVVLVNLVTANRIVRAVLRFAQGPTAQNAPVETGSEFGAPRAGRVIGVLERYLLIVLVVGGQALSIAGLAAAKSIIRYPEISRSADGKNGLSAEVFFIGTITSWMFALASAGLLVLVAH